MFGKIKITADIKVQTGLHIGSNAGFTAIGAVGAPVIRDARTQLPILPGSSLKGKMRTLLARKYSNSYVLDAADKDVPKIARLFGTAPKDKNEKIKLSRLQFSDCFLKNAEQLKEIGLTEIKFENTITRETAVANPRQIERVIRGAIFGMTIIYETEEESQISEDFKTISEGLQLLQADYLGGNGTRGYGRISFHNFDVQPVMLNSPIDLSGFLTDLKGVEENAVFNY